MQDITKRDFQLEIITGMSGAGKSQVIQSLEDLGFIVWIICLHFNS